MSRVLGGVHWVENVGVGIQCREWGGVVKGVLDAKSVLIDEKHQTT